MDQVHALQCDKHFMVPRRLDEHLQSNWGLLVVVLVNKHYSDPLRSFFTNIEAVSSAIGKTGVPREDQQTLESEQTIYV